MTAHNEDRTVVNGHPRQADRNPPRPANTTILADKRRPTLHATRPNTHDGRQQPPPAATAGPDRIPSTNPTTGHGVGAVPPRTPTPPTQPAISNVCDPTHTQHQHTQRNSDGPPPATVKQQATYPQKYVDNVLFGVFGCGYTCVCCLQHPDVPPGAMFCNM